MISKILAGTLFLSTVCLASCTQTSSADTPSDKIRVTKEDGKLKILHGDVLLLAYQFEKMPAPEGVDTLYAKSGFIHPLNTPQGQTLTRIQPPDHYHHYGIWNPWTHVLYDGDTLDFWNLSKGEGFIRFGEFLETESDGMTARVVLTEEHVVLKSGEVALNEQKILTVSGITADSYLLDIDITYESTDKPFRILEYRYEGLGWRATEEWNKENSEIFTPGADSRNDVDGTTDRWCVVQGSLGDGYGGAVMMSHPENFNHPEPLRVWPSEQNSRGDVFASFSTTKNTDWLLEPGKKYALKYRFLVFNGKMDKARAESAWQEYAAGQ